MLRQMPEVTPPAVKVASRAKPLSPKQREIVKNALQECVNEYVEEIRNTSEQVRDEGKGDGASMYGVHSEQGSHVIAEDSAIAILSRYGNGASDLVKAHRRIHNDWKTFDLCASCGHPIGFGRLLCNPGATLCVLCQGGARKRDAK